MNVYYLDSDPTEAAMALHNKHVVRISLVSAQIMCAALYIHGVTDVPYKSERFANGVPGKFGGRVNPWVMWASKSLSNFLWLGMHGTAVAGEYTMEYGKIHRSERVIDWAMTKIASIPENGFTEPPQCMPEKYKSDDPVMAYRNYYINEKLPDGTSWGCRGVPLWIPEWFTMSD